MGTKIGPAATPPTFKVAVRMFWDFFQWRSLKTRVTVFTLAIFVISIWSLALYASRMLREDMQRLLGEQQFSIVSFIAETVNQELQERLRALGTVAGEVTQSEMNNTAMLQAHLEQRPILGILFNGGYDIVSPDGVVIADVPLTSGRIGKNYLSDEWIAQALKEGKSMIGGPLMGPALRAPVFVMTMPIREPHGKVIGALNGVVNLGKPNFLDNISQGHYGKTGGFLLVSSESRLVVAASDKSRVMTHLPAQGLIPELDRFLQGYDGTQVFINPLGVESLVSKKHSRVANWGLVVSLPIEEAFGPIRDMQQRILLAAVLLTFLAAGLTWWMIRRELSPMFAVLKHLIHLSHSDKALEPLPAQQGGSEISELIDGFNRFLRTLGQREEWLKASEARFKVMFDESPLGIALIDSLTGHIHAVNSAFARIAGRTLEEMATIGWMSITHPDDVQKELDSMALLNAKKIPGFQMEKRYIRPDGAVVWISMTIAPIHVMDEAHPRHLCMVEDVTERKQQEQELLSNRRRLVRAEAIAHVGHWSYEVAEQSVEWSDELWNIYDRKPHSVELTYDTITSWIREDFRAFHHEKLSQMLALKPGEAFKDFVFCLVRPDGEQRWAEVFLEVEFDQGGTPVRFFGVVEDITERRQANAERERLLRIIEEAPDFIATSDMQAHLKYLNNAGARLVGLPEEFDLTGLEIKDMHPAWGTKLVLEEGIPAVLEKGYWQHENVLLHKDGHEVPVSQMLLVHRDASGSPQMLSTIMRDITERKAAEARLVIANAELVFQNEQKGKREVELMAARETADAANRAKSDFLSTMSHEIRTPLNGVIGNIQLLEMSALDQEQTGYLSAIAQSSSNLLSLINDILDLSKIEAERVILEQVDFSLRGCISNVVLTQRSRIVQKGLALKLDIPNEVPDVLVGDDMRVKQVLLNLLGNAIKFTRKGGITLSVSVKKRAGEIALLEVSVSDTGIGISQEAMEGLFKPFVQADSSVARNFGGSGLGLAICERLSRLMGGSISAESTEGVGSIFRVLLPLSVSDRAMPRADVREPASQALWTGQPLKVLLAEDNQISQQFGVVLLNKMGHQVAVAENGKQALAALGREACDIVLMDIRMPVMNGDEALAVLRERELASGKRLPVIAITAYALKGDKEKYLALGFDGYVSKPLEVKRLIAEMKRVLEVA